jgi:hypothetical protein
LLLVDRMLHKITAYVSIWRCPETLLFGIMGWSLRINNGILCC